MKIKDITLKDSIVFKYFACKFVMTAMTSVGEEAYVNETISNLAKDRLAEKHGIKNADTKNIDQVVLEVTKQNNMSDEERGELLSSVYDYVVNNFFKLKNLNIPDDEEFIFPEALIINCTDSRTNDLLKMTYASSTMQLMPKEHFLEIQNKYPDTQIKMAMHSIAIHTGNEYVIVIM